MKHVLVDKHGSCDHEQVRRIEMSGRSVRYERTCALVVLTTCLLTLIGTGHAIATKLRQIEFTCAICETQFMASVVLATNSNGGIDSDFLARSEGEQAEPYYISSCPHCRFTAYQADFQGVTDEELVVIAQTQSEMENLPFDIPSDDVPGSVKYSIAAKLYAALGRDPRTVGDCLLRAAWCRRIEGPKILDFSEELGNAYSNSMSLLEAQLDSQQIDLEWNDIASYTRALRALDVLQLGGADTETLYARDFLKVYFLQRLGENVNALKILKSLSKRAIPDTWPVILSRAIQDSITSEMGLHKQAAMEFRKALSRKDIPENELAIIYYIIGENLHRSGRNRESIQWFKRALANADLPDWLQSITHVQLLLVSN